MGILCQPGALCSRVCAATGSLARRWTAPAAYNWRGETVRVGGPTLGPQVTASTEPAASFSIVRAPMSRLLLPLSRTVCVLREAEGCFLCFFVFNL